MGVGVGQLNCLIPETWGCDEIGADKIHGGSAAQEGSVRCASERLLCVLSNGKRILEVTV